MLDLALADPWIDLTKFAGLPLLVGLPLGLSWPSMPALGRAFLWANFIPKLGAIGGLYLAAPTRLCAYYRLDQQAGCGGGADRNRRRARHVLVSRRLHRLAAILGEEQRRA